MISYYKPYLGVFWADMFFATVSAAVALVIPLVIRYVTSTLIYMEPQAILGQIRWIALMLFALVAVDCYSRFFIANQGHVMGAKIEYDMRAEIFAHFQKRDQSATAADTVAKNISAQNTPRYGL